MIDIPMYYKRGIQTPPPYTPPPPGGTQVIGRN